ncbi:MAG TPA: M48 family metallopeptidase [Flavisolibacter sp.]|nr:M48 family metallopeptidase [Flavisolibacter sp.]
MPEHTALYYTSTDSIAIEVRILLFNHSVHLYSTHNNELLYRAPLSTTWYKQINGKNLLFLDDKSSSYVEIPHNHPVLINLAKEVSYTKSGWFKQVVKKRTTYVILFMIAFLVGVYFAIMAFIPWLGSRMISTQREIQIGEGIKSVMLKEAILLGETEDTVSSVKLQQFADALQLSRQYPIRITVLKSKTVNAYALPGGNIVVYTGLLKKIESPEALAALLAHETAHVNERHSLRSLLRSAATGIIISVVFGDAGGVGAVLLNNAEVVTGLQYSRSLEKEADRKGMELLVENKINAKGMQLLLQTLQAEEIKLPQTTSFLRSHPLTEQRLKDAEEFIKTYPQAYKENNQLHVLFRGLIQGANTW